MVLVLFLAVYICLDNLRRGEIMGKKKVDCGLLIDRSFDVLIDQWDDMEMKTKKTLVVLMKRLWEKYKSAV